MMSRLKEAEKLGFKRAVIPQQAMSTSAVKLELQRMGHVTGQPSNTDHCRARLGD